MPSLSLQWNTTTLIVSLAIGLFAGMLSGLFGVGGGVVIVPLVFYLFHVTQQTASATSMVALLLPVGVLGVVQYYKAGLLGPEHMRLGVLIAVGMFFGALFGAKLALSVPELWLKRGFSLLLFFVAVKLFRSTL